MYYILIKNNKIQNAGQCPAIDEDIINYEVNKELYDDFIQNPLKYIFKDGEITENENYEQEIAKQERERLDNLSMTRGDVFEALILAKNLDEETLKTKIEALEIDETTKKLYLNRLKNAQNFYRGYPIFDLLAQDKELGITSAMLDEFFETGDYRKLVRVEEVKESQDNLTIEDEKEIANNSSEDIDNL